MKKTVCTLILCCIGLFTFTCVDDPFHVTETSGDKKQITILVKSPKPSITRASDIPDDSKIDFSTLKILLFGEDGFIESVDALSTNYKENEDTYEIKIDLPKYTAKVDLVLIVNAVIPEPVTRTSKSDFYKNAIIEIKGKWDIAAKKMPFWGEHNDLELDENSELKNNYKINVALIRSLARVDFFVDIPAKEDNSGVNKSNIALKSVFVYNSLDKAYLAPDPDNYDDNHKTTATTVPENASFNGDDDSSSSEDNKEYTLLYNQIHDNSITGQIYLPEQQCAGENAKGPLFFVIGAVYGADQNTTYYRIDLKEKGNSGELLNLLRNHNYIVNIKGVNGPGYETPQKAAAQGSSNIEVNVVEWDNGINEGYINGNKFFGINSSDIMFEDYKKEQTHEIKYKTNFSPEEISETLKFYFKTKEKPYFSAELDTENTRIIVKTLTNNIGSDILEDSLTIHCVSKDFKLKVSQKPKISDYYLVCDSTVVHGLFQKNVPLNKNNYILVSAESEHNLSGRKYDIHTNKLDGLSFHASGEFDMKLSNGKYRQQIKLQGEGTAVTSIKKEFIIIPNTSVYSTCNAIVKMAFGKKTIAGYSLNQIEGFDTNSGLSKILREDIGNYGLTDNSVVKVEPLTYITYNYISLVDNNDDVRYFTDAINNKTDIIIIGYDTYFNTNTYSYQVINALINYLQKGGIVFLMCEFTNSNILFFQTLYDTLYPKKGVTITSSGNIPTYYCFPFVYQPNDPIANGPFGSTNGKYWGQDDLNVKALRGLPEEDLIIYSRSVQTGKESVRYDQGLTIFRLKEYKLLYIGDGGFIGGYDNTSNNFHRFPFMINRKLGSDLNKNLKQGDYDDLPLNYPIPKLYDNPTERSLVYNSVFFANALAWAIEEAEYNGINSKK